MAVMLGVLLSSNDTLCRHLKCSFRRFCGGSPGLCREQRDCLLSGNQNDTQSLHSKYLDQVREGGLVAFIASGCDERRQSFHQDGAGEACRPNGDVASAQQYVLRQCRVRPYHFPEAYKKESIIG